MRGRARALALVGFAGAILGAVVALSLEADRPGIPSFESTAGKASVFATVAEPERCASCHGLGADAWRAQAAAPEAREHREVVVVGGGLSGLAAAFALRDRDVVVLEKDAGVGGKMRSGAWQGIAYSKGAAYMTEPTGEIARLLAELGLEPIVLEEPVNSAFAGGKLYLDCWSDEGIDRLPYEPAGRAALKKAFADIRALGEGTAVPARDASDEVRALDRMTIAKWCKRYGRPEVATVIRPYVRSCFGGDMGDVSALAALTFPAAEFGPIRTVPGGHAAVPARIAERLAAEKGADVVRTGAFVTEVRSTGEGDAATVLVTYRMPDGAMRTIEAKAAIVATGAYVTKHIVKGDVPASRREALDKVTYAAYLVAAVKLARPVHRATYDTWFLDANAPLTDVVVADYVTQGAPDGDEGTTPAPAPERAHVLTVYAPQGSGGRGDFLATEPKAYEERLVNELERAFPGVLDALEGVELFAHGHAMHIPYPTYVTDVAPALQASFGRIFFAGVDLDLPCMESAIWSGTEAARGVRAAIGAPAAPRRPAGE